MSRQVVVRCIGLGKRFGAVEAVVDLSLEVEQGQLLALLGPSGCGKTTVLRAIAGFEVPDQGTVEVEGRTMAGPGVFVPPQGRQLGMVFQEYALFPHLDVAGNVAFGLPRDAGRSTRVQEVLELVRLQGMARRMPHQLSGGQQQRVALARALAPRPRVLLLDEPFSNLDPTLRQRVRGEVKEILVQAGVTTLFVTHDQEEALFMGDRVAVMNAGRLEQVGTTEVVFHHPATAFVARFLGVADFLPGQVRGEMVVTDLRPFPAPPGVPPGTQLELMVRPDDVDLRPVEGEGEGTVVERVFQGSHYLYTVQLPSGRRLRSLQSHSHPYPLGAPVLVRIDPGHDLVCFQDGRAVGLSPGAVRGL